MKGRFWLVLSIVTAVSVAISADISSWRVVALVLLVATTYLTAFVVENRR